MIAPPKPPAHDELEALIKEARERQLRRRLLGAAGVAIAAAVVLTGHALLLGGRTPGVSGIGSPQGGAALCRGSQISVAAIWDGAAGHLFNFFTITNRGAGTCSLPLGHPTASLTRGGSQLKVDERAGSPFGVPGKPVHVLAPGERAVVHLAWWNWCGANRAFAQTRTTVTVQFPGGLHATAPNLLGQPPCMDSTEPSVLTVSAPLTPS